MEGRLPGGVVSFLRFVWDVVFHWPGLFSAGVWKVIFLNPFDPAGPLLEHTPMPGGPILFHNFGRLFLGEPALFIG